MSFDELCIRCLDPTCVGCRVAGDLIAHDTAGGDCVCGPTTEPVPRDDGSIGWLVVHHSLDGRENHE